MIKRLLNLRGLFSNTKFLVVFSIVLAFIFWVVVALEYTPIIRNDINDVPVRINLEGSTAERLGLRYYGATDIKINITVEGKRYDVGGKKISADDFIVEAETAYVDSAGEKALAVKVTPKNDDAEFEIVGLSTDYINVFFDREASKEISIKPNITSDTEHIAAEGYKFYEEEILADKTVKISGPKTEIDKIQSAYLDLSVDNGLTKSKSVQGSIRFETNTQDEIKYVKVNDKELNELNVSATLPIYKVQSLPVAVNFANSPEEYLSNQLKYYSYPSMVEVAVLQDGANELTKLVVGEIDFADVNPDNYVFRFSASEIHNAKVLDDIDEFIITLQLPKDIVSETMSVKKNSIIIQGASEYDVFDVDFDAVTICSGSDELDMIEPQHIHGVIDLKGVTLQPDGQKVPVKFNVFSAEKCWVTGDYYATIKPKKK